MFAESCEIIFRLCDHDQFANAVPAQKLRHIDCYKNIN